ncbi:MAG: Hint domain-containing protein [Myxococcales bacterium]|nr:Hint domain-containing protein [Myxococcales bacterium]
MGKLLRPPAAIEPVDASTPDRVFFFDGCWEARAPTKAAAARACAEAQRGGDRWSRRWCRCRPSDLVEVKADDPIAYYLYGSYGEEDNHCGGAGPTPLAAWRACTIRQLEMRARWPESACACPTGGDAAKGKGPSAVRGPYTRTRGVGEFDDPEAYAYLDPATGDWLDRHGEVPCFVAGTPVATPDGPRAIEALRPGDAVIAWDLEAGEEVVAEVVGRRAKTSEALLHLTLDSGDVITTTPNHPFFAEDADAWLDAGALRPGDRLRTRMADGGAATVAIRSIVEVVDADAPTEVLSISVTPPHTYFAGGALVHNY